MATKDDLLKHLDTTIDGLSKVARMLPGGAVPEEVVTLAPMAAEAYKLVRDVMASGHDPEDVIGRMRAAKVWLDGAEEDWRKALDAKFGANT